MGEATPIYLQGESEMGREAEKTLATDPEWTIPAKDRFQVLFAQSGELAKALPTYQFQFSAALVVVLGWLLTSDNTARFLAAHRGACRWGSTVIVGVLIVFHIAWLGRHVQRAHRLHQALASFARRSFPESEALVASVAIDPFLPLSYVVVNVLLCGAILVVCWSLSGA